MKLDNLIGHENIVQILDQCLQQQKHHAIIIEGSKSIGKYTLAHQYISQVLLKKTYSNKNEIITHHDISIIKKLDDKKDINIEQIREINQFSATKPTSLLSKIIVIDSIGDLNKNSANALLKTLEQPPSDVIFILICHNIKRVISTILSRCIVLKAKTLSTNEVCQILQNKYKETKKEELIEAAKIAEGNVNIAINYIEYKAKEFYQSFLRDILTNGNTYEAKLKEIKTHNITLIELFEHLFIRINHSLALMSIGITNTDIKFEQDFCKYFLNKNHLLSVEIYLNLKESLDMMYKAKAFNEDLKYIISTVITIIKQKEDPFLL